MKYFASGSGPGVRTIEEDENPRQKTRRCSSSDSTSQSSVGYHDLVFSRSALSKVRQFMALPAEPFERKGSLFDEGLDQAEPGASDMEAIGSNAVRVHVPIRKWRRKDRMESWMVSRRYAEEVLLLPRAVQHVVLVPSANRSSTTPDDFRLSGSSLSSTVVVLFPGVQLGDHTREALANSVWAVLEFDADLEQLRSTTARGLTLNGFRGIYRQVAAASTMQAIVFIFAVWAVFGFYYWPAGTSNASGLGSLLGVVSAIVLKEELGPTRYGDIVRAVAFGQQRVFAEPGVGYAYSVLVPALLAFMDMSTERYKVALGFAAATTVVLCYSTGQTLGCLKPHWLQRIFYVPAAGAEFVLAVSGVTTAFHVFKAVRAMPVERERCSLDNFFYRLGLMRLFLSSLAVPLGAVVMYHLLVVKKHVLEPGHAIVLVIAAVTAFGVVVLRPWNYLYINGAGGELLGAAPKNLSHSEPAPGPWEASSRKESLGSGGESAHAGGNAHLNHVYDPGAAGDGFDHYAATAVLSRFILYYNPSGVGVQVGSYQNRHTSNAKAFYAGARAAAPETRATQLWSLRVRAAY